MGEDCLATASLQLRVHKCAAFGPSVSVSNSMEEEFPAFLIDISNFYGFIYRGSYLTHVPIWFYCFTVHFYIFFSCESAAIFISF